MLKLGVCFSARGLVWRCQPTATYQFTPHIQIFLTSDIFSERPAQLVEFWGKKRIKLKPEFKHYRVGILRSEKRCFRLYSPSNRPQTWTDGEFRSVKNNNRYINHCNLPEKIHTSLKLLFSFTSLKAF